MNNSYDYLIVGAGFFGSVLAERIATQLNKKVLIIDKRNHIGGNCYSEIDTETGIEFHTYGTHIFHTSSHKVWQYINQFTKFNSYHHQVLSTHKGKVFQMPINLETINSFYQINLRPFEVDSFLKNEIAKEDYPSPSNLEEKMVSQVGRPLYEAFIKGYSLKQWGKDPKTLPASIIDRIPIRNNYNENYFSNARWYGIPIDGYTKVFEKLLESPNIDVKLNCDFFDIKDHFKPSKKTIYTGPIDEFFDFQFGKLEWRTVHFKKEVIPVSDYQGVSVMNFADPETKFTRIHEPKHLHPERYFDQENFDKTIIFYETSSLNEQQPYYPINDPHNNRLLKEYKNEANKISALITGGRLGNYKYCDMDTTIEAALNCFDSSLQ